MQTEYLEFSTVNNAPYNPRVTLKPGDPEWTQIEGAIKKFGLVGGLVWNKRTGHAVGGHQRIAVAKHLGHTGAHFVIVDLSLEDEKALNLILNKVSGRWETRKLADVLKDLKGAQYDLNTLGFSPKEAADAIGKPDKKPKVDPNKAYPFPDEKDAKTALGDVYLLHSQPGLTHRLMCGDSRDAESMAKLCQDTKARLYFTDPPYGIDYRGGKIKNDALKGDALRDFLIATFKAANPHLRPKVAIYTFYAALNHVEAETAMLAVGWKVKQALVWAKNIFSIGRDHFHWMHEPLFYGCRLDEVPEWFGNRAEKTIFEKSISELEKLSKEEAVAMLKDMQAMGTFWQEDRDSLQAYIHHTQKPISLAKRALANNTLPGDTVLDTFLGSGSTLIACETMGRYCNGMELHRGICDSIVRRFLTVFEGAKAERNGEPFTLADL